jgi:hypothetical protein
MGLPHRYPMTTYPYARNAEEEGYYRRTHYLTSALYLLGAAEDVLNALGEVYQRTVNHQDDSPVRCATSGEPHPDQDLGRYGLAL